MGFCRRLLKRLASQDVGGAGDGGAAAALGATRDRRNSGAADTSTQRLMLAQRQFHGHLIDYELIFAQVFFIFVLCFLFVILTLTLTIFSKTSTGAPW